MTIRNFGYITPLQMAILMMCGLRLTRERGTSELLYSPEETLTIAAMNEGRLILRKITGEDFGFSLSAWHDFLSTDETFKKQYLWPRTWESVSRAVMKSIKDPDRLRMEELAQSAKATEK